MGKKGSWFSAIKRVFIPNSKDKLVDGLDKRDVKEKKKKGQEKLKSRPSFIPLFKEPSTIEEILGEAEREHHLIDFRPISPFEQPHTPSFTPSQSTTPLQTSYSPWTPTPQRVVSTTPKISTPQRVANSPMNGGSTSQRAFVAPKIAIPQRTASSPGNSARKEAGSSSSQGATPLNVGVSPRSTSSRYVHRPRPEPTLRYQNMCATRIQAAYRGYMARRSYRSLRGLVRLQGVVKGQSVKRQTVNAMKCMQLLVRVQTQIQSRRIQMLENQTLQRQKNDKDLEKGNGKWNLSQMSENGNPDDWDDSRLTKEEIEARTHRKYEAIIKRERAMAYAYSHQSWKASTKMPQAALMDIRSSGGYPWWWNWLDKSNQTQNQNQNPSTTPAKPSESEAIKNIFSTPPRPNATSPFAPRSAQPSPGFDRLESATPRSTRSKPTNNNNATKPRGTDPKSSPLGSRFKDDDSLTSCPAFSAPRYMEATASAKAKLKSGFKASPEVETKRRGSFSLAHGIGSFKWNKRGSLFSAMATPSRDTAGAKKNMMQKQSLQSIGNLSVDSTVSMPATVGRKPFNRFV